jgi:hypothetical protein
MDELCAMKFFFLNIGNGMIIETVIFVNIIKIVTILTVMDYGIVILSESETIEPLL